jgi:hypothetical protein
VLPSVAPLPASRPSESGVFMTGLPNYARSFTAI